MGQNSSADWVHNSGTGLISSRSSDDWPFYYGTGPIRLRSSDDWPRRPRVSCLYAFQIGAQCQRPSFPSFSRPSRLAVEESAATVFSRSRPLLFLPFTRLRLNNTKRGMQIPHRPTTTGSQSQFLVIQQATLSLHCVITAYSIRAPYHVLYNNSIKYLFQKFRISFNFILLPFQPSNIKAISVQHALHAHN